MTAELKLATAIREVTGTILQFIDSGQRSARIDQYDLVETLLASADRIDPDGA